MRSLIVLLLVCNACGYEMPEQQQNQNDLAETEVEEKPEETTDRKPPKEDKKTGNGIEVNVDVNVEINQYNGYAEKWLFQGAPATWSESNSEAPEGYRLPTRTELLEGFEDGDFDGISGLVVWSSSELVREPGYMMGVNLGTGTEYRYFSGIKLHVVYILR